MQRTLISTVSILVLVCGLQADAWAQDPIHKAGRGLTNVLTGWIEVPKQIHMGSQEANPVTGLAWGFVKGVGLTVLRGGVGIYEAVTFAIPYPKDFASPYDLMELTDYAWE
jgi:putative exosortase-associated protein (TIGR04073 family)